MILRCAFDFQYSPLFSFFLIKYLIIDGFDFFNQEVYIFYSHELEVLLTLPMLRLLLSNGIMHIRTQRFSKTL